MELDLEDPSASQGRACQGMLFRSVPAVGSLRSLCLSGLFVSREVVPVAFSVCVSQDMVGSGCPVRDLSNVSQDLEILLS